MIEERNKVHLQFKERVSKLGDVGVNEKWQWVLSMLWGVDGAGKQWRWEEMSWKAFYQTLQNRGEATLNEEEEVVWCSGRGRLLAHLCMLSPTDLRWGGLIDWRWEK